MPVSVGDKLGPYEILAPIGAGGMGEVWKARDPRLDRIVAIKRLKGEHGGRFAREARAIAALNHPHICQIYDVGPDYLVMEYIDGQPLRGPMPYDEAARLAIQIASALEASHARGILHRDLKPANVLVTKSGAKLVDFGLAKIAQAGPDDETAHTIEGLLMGTAAYMSPEQAQGKAVDERSDVFSFGAVLYEMLSGRRAFGGESLAETLSAVMRDTPAPLDSPMAGIVNRCLLKAPSQRFSNMGEVRAELEKIALAKPADRQPSIAVLPFANMSGDKEQEYFSDGLAEEILNLLAQIRGLKVIARTSSFAFRGKEQDITEIASALGVQTILEGSMRRSGTRIRVTAQLIQAADGSHLWSERYDRELADVFAVQDEIAQAITTALRVKLSPSTEDSQAYTPNLNAHEALLKARYHYARYSRDAVHQAMAYLEQAIALDSKFALPHAWLAKCYLDLALYSATPIRDAVTSARLEAYRALDLDPSSPEPRATLGVIAAVYEYDWAEAARQFGKSMGQQPVAPNIRGSYGWYLILAGQAEQGEEMIAQALLEDPVNAMLYFEWGLCLHAAGRTVEASEAFRQCLELEAGHLPTLYWLTRNCIALGDVANALANAEKAYSLSPWNTEAIGGLAGLSLQTSDRSRAIELLGKLEDSKAYGVPIGLANCYLVSAEPEKAADWIEKAIEQRHPLAGLYLRSPLSRGLRNTARWSALAKIMNLPSGAASA